MKNQLVTLLTVGTAFGLGIASPLQAQNRTIDLSKFKRIQVNPVPVQTKKKVTPPRTSTTRPAPAIKIYPGTPIKKVPSYTNKPSIPAYKPVVPAFKPPTTKVVPRPRPSTQPSGSEQIAQMVKALKGANLSTKVTPKKPIIIDRTVKFNPKVLPKGSPGFTNNYPRPAMKAGKAPAQGFETPKGGGTTLYMKKGQEKAQGNGGLVSNLSNNGGGGGSGYLTPPNQFGSTGNHSSVGNHQYPGGGHGHTGSTAYPQNHGFHASHQGAISYRVDQSAQLSTNEIKFRKNSTELADQSSYQYLYNLAHALLNPALIHDNFVIEGHASAEGSASSNQSLSQRRANAIYDFMVNQGIAPSRLLSVGHGEAHARYSSSSPEYLRAQDRRVIVLQTGPIILFPLFVT